MTNDILRQGLGIKLIDTSSDGHNGFEHSFVLPNPTQLLVLTVASDFSAKTLFFDFVFSSSTYY